MFTADHRCVRRVFQGPRGRLAATRSPRCVRGIHYRLLPETMLPETSAGEGSVRGGSGVVVSSGTIDSLLKEKEQYPPSAAFRKAAVLRSDSFRLDAAKDPEAFWARMAKELAWMAPWSKVLEWDPPFAKWFVGGKLNMSANCLDRHLAGPRRNKAALVWEGEPGERRVLTYHDMWRGVSRFANVLKGLGVKRGDRVTIYMPMIPELPIAMLACARVGAVHSVIFGGVSARAIRDRAGDAEAHVIVTADGGYRRGTVLPPQKIVDEAI